MAHYYIDLPPVKFVDADKQALFDDIRRRMRLAGIRTYLMTDKGIERAESVGLGEALFEDYSERPAYYDRAIDKVVEAGLAMVDWEHGAAVDKQPLPVYNDRNNTWSM